MALNRVVLSGRITRDPELKTTAAGIPIVSFSIAVDRNFKNDQGGHDTDFFNITGWRRVAEFVSQYLKKGRLVEIDGRLQVRSWVDQSTGMKRSTIDVIADEVYPVGPRPAEDETHDAATTYQATGTAPVEEADEDDPFENA